jgi:hypothetical protein
MSYDNLQGLISMSLVWSYKLATLLIGYLFARLGYDLLLKGVTGSFKFSTELKGIKADLISASPGLFFIIMGAVIVSIGLYRGLTIDVRPGPPVIVAPTPTPKPQLPPTPPLPAPPREGGQQ